MTDMIGSDSANNSWRQLFRYGLVGIAINLLGYLIYLLLTFLGLTPKLTMTLLYFIGAFAGFWGNRNLTFRHQGSVLGSGVRYLVAHGLGYLINLLILVVFVDQLGFTHQYVQAIAIFVVAGYLFIAFKFFVFTHLETLAGNRP